MGSLNHIPLIIPYLAEGGRVFGLDQQTLIQIGINLFNVAVLAFVLSKLLYNPVRNFMRKRSEGIESQLEHAEKESKGATALRLEYERKLKEIDVQKEAILEEARKLAADNRGRMMLEAKAEADALKARAASEIEAEYARAREEMRQAIIEISALMTEKLVMVSIDSDTQERLFNEAMGELEGATWRS